MRKPLLLFAVLAATISFDAKSNVDESGFGAQKIAVPTASLVGHRLTDPDGFFSVQMPCHFDVLKTLSKVPFVATCDDGHKLSFTVSRGMGMIFSRAENANDFSEAVREARAYPGNVVTLVRRNGRDAAEISRVSKVGFFLGLVIEVKPQVLLILEVGEKVEPKGVTTDAAASLAVAKRFFDSLEIFPK